MSNLNIAYSNPNLNIKTKPTWNIYHLFQRLWIFGSRYLNSSTFNFTSLPSLSSCSFTFTPVIHARVLFCFSWLSFLFFWRAYPHLSRLSYSCTLVSLYVTVSSASIIVHGQSCPTSSANSSITTTNKKGLRADHSSCLDTWYYD